MKNPLKSMKNIKSKFIKGRKSESSIDIVSGGSSTSEPDTTIPESPAAKVKKEEIDTATSLTNSQPITSNDEEDQILSTNNTLNDEVIIVDEDEIINGTSKEDVKTTEEKQTGLKFPKMSVKKMLKTDLLEKGKEGLSKVKNITEKVATSVAFKKIDEEKEEEIKNETKVEENLDKNEEKEEIKEEVIVSETKEEEEVLKDDKKEVKVKEAWRLKISISQIIYSMLIMMVLSWCAIIWKFKYNLFSLIYYIVPGVIFGLIYVYLYKNNAKNKKITASELNLELGIKGLTALLGNPPSWLSYTEKERVEFLNKMMLMMWPYYDKAVCDTIKETVEPIMMLYCPSIFKRIGFKTIRFGEVPFRIEGVKLDVHEDEIILDVDIRWCGDANITLAIELTSLPGVTDATRVAPKIKDISMVGTVRLIFKPLIDVYPGFGAVIVSFIKQPLLHFSIDLGKAFGGSTIGATLRATLRPFINDTLLNMLVWPQRIVCPIIYDEEVTGPINDLYLRDVGLLKVTVVEARNLPAADMSGKSDPMVEMFTNPTRILKTGVIKQTLNPKWDNEHHHFFVKDPRTQDLKLTVYDIDFLNAKEMMKSLNIIQNLKDTLNAKEFLGRVKIPILSVYETSGTVMDDWYSLGPNEWNNEDGCGCGKGEIRLKLKYIPFISMKTSESKIGAVIATIEKCQNLKAMDSVGTSDPYLKVRMGKKEFKSLVIKECLNPIFNVTYSFFDVTDKDVLEIEVYDKDFGRKDDFLGSYHLEIEDLKKSVYKDNDEGVVRGCRYLEGVEIGKIYVNIRYIALDLD